MHNQSHPVIAEVDLFSSFNNKKLVEYRMLRLTKRQQEVYDFVVGHPKKHVFVHGPAGTGKSVIRNKILSDGDVLTLGPTGISIDGCKNSMTIARFCARPPKRLYSTILLEEAGMITSSDFDDLERVCVAQGGGFSKQRLVFILDLRQMQPVGGSYFFEGRSWISVSRSLMVFNLTENLRIIDRDAEARDELMFFLNRLRYAEFFNSSRAMGLLDHVISRRLPRKDAVWLCTTNALANKINKDKLDTVEDEVFTVYNDKNERRLSAFIGANVQVTKNVYANKTLVVANGTVGKIVSTGGIKRGDCVRITPSCAITIKTSENKTVRLKPVKDNNGDLYFGLTLAYALTLHRAQGLSFDSIVVVNDGQRKLTLAEAYTAFSRVRCLSGVSTVNVTSWSIAQGEQSTISFMRSMGLV